MLLFCIITCSCIVIPPAFIVFVIPFCPFIYSFVCYSVTLTKMMSKFCVKVSQMGISQQPLIRKHSYLDHGYLGRSAYIP